jgi:hypothetical protein
MDNVIISNVTQFNCYKYVIISKIVIGNVIISIDVVSS